MGRRRFLISLWGGVCVCGLCRLGEADEPTLADLMKLAPLIETSDEACRSLMIRGEHNAKFLRLSFLVRYKAPDKFALWIADAEYGTPLVMQSDRRALMYDAIGGRLIELVDVNCQFAIKCEDDKLRLRERISGLGERSSISLDLRSFYNNFAAETRMNSERNGAFRLTRNLTGGRRVVALVDPSRRCAFKEFEFFWAELKDPVCAIKEISFDDVGTDLWRALPTREELQGRVKTVSFSEVCGEDADIERAVMRSVLSYVPVRRKECRKAYENKYGAHVDWHAIEKQDGEISPR